MRPRAPQHCTADSRGRAADGTATDGRLADFTTSAHAARPARRAALGRYDLTVLRAREEWTQIRWSLFVFPDITDVAPTDDPDIVRIYYEGRRAYPDVWRVALLQAGFEVPALEPARWSDVSSPPGRPCS